MTDKVAKVKLGTAVDNHYTYRVFWSAEDQEYVGAVAEFPSLSWLADSPVDALVGIQRVVADVISDLEAAGEPIPQAMADKQYSGKFVVRVSKDVHRRLAVEAAEQGVSLNALAATRLAA